jgi:hypothetical protein
MSTKYGPKIITDGLILYWDVGNSKSYTSGSSVIYDLSGNNNNGTVTNSYVTYSSDFGGVITFDGTINSRVSIANASFDKRTGTYTVIAASRYSGATRARIITSFNNWLLGHWAGRANVHYAEGWVEYYGTFPPGINDTNWRIYAGTGNTNTDIWQFYINDTLMTSNSGGSQGPYGIQIGGLGGESSNGQFSFLQFYNRVLTASEVLQNYNALKGRFNL